MECVTKAMANELGPFDHRERHRAGLDRTRSI
jgi:hypothetical protein